MLLENTPPARSGCETCTLDIGSGHAYEGEYNVDKFAGFFKVCCVEDIEKDIAIKPYPNEHACRLKDPGNYEKFKRGKRKSGDKEYSIIFGKLKGQDKWEEQAYRYDKKVWTEKEAKKHCEEHKGISFEPASEKEVPKSTEVPAQIVNVKIDMGELTELIESTKLLNDSVKLLISTLEELKAVQVPEARDKPSASSVKEQKDDSGDVKLNINLEPTL